jgi:hypothetical protein
MTQTTVVLRCWTAWTVGIALGLNQRSLVGAFSPTRCVHPQGSRDAFVRNFEGRQWSLSQQNVRQRIKTSCLVHAAGDTPPALPDPYLQPLLGDGPDNSPPLDEMVLFEQQSILSRPPAFADSPLLASDTNEAPQGQDEANEAGPLDPEQTHMGSPPSPPPLSVWQGRGIVVGAAAIYGTNFAAIKLLDPVVPVAVSAALRFCLAAATVTAAVV